MRSGLRILDWSLLDCVVLSIVWDFDFIIYICLFENFKDFKNKVIVVLYLII